LNLREELVHVNSLEHLALRFGYSTCENLISLIDPVGQFSKSVKGRIAIVSLLQGWK